MSQSAVEYELTKTVRHQVSLSAGPQNEALVLHSVPVHLPTLASQQSCSDSINSNISCARVSVLQPAGSDDTSVDTVETHLEALTQHVAGRLVGPGASVAAEAKVLMDSGSGITAISEELVEAL